MRERKIYSVLVLLSKEEHRLFRDYLVSPLFEPSKTMQEFFRLWESKILTPDSTADRSYTAEEFLEGTKLLPSRIDKYCTHLYKRLLDFLGLQQYMQSQDVRFELTADALEQRNAPSKEWDSQRILIQKDIESSSESSAKLLRQLNYKWKAIEARIYTRDTQAIWQEDFRELHQAMDSYYYLQKLKLACAGANARLIYNQNRDAEDDAPDLLLKFDDETAKASLGPLGYSYWLTLRLYNSDDGSDELEVLFAHLHEVGSLFESEEASEVFNYALNYCTRRANKGEVRYQKYAAALYRELLENKSILKDGMLPPQIMKNILVIHCLVGELEWAERFLEEYRDRLQGDPDPYIIKYNLAVLTFYQHDRNCIGLLKEVISNLKDDIFYELDSRIYLLKAYFDHLKGLSIEETDDMYRVFDSFRVFIDRNKVISPMHKQRYRNFITEFRRFLKLIESGPKKVDQKRLQKLDQKVRASEYMANKSWFLAKINSFVDASKE